MTKLVLLSKAYDVPDDWITERPWQALRDLFDSIEFHEPVDVGDKYGQCYAAGNKYAKAAELTPILAPVWDAVLADHFEIAMEALPHSQAYTPGQRQLLAEYACLQIFKEHSEQFLRQVWKWLYPYIDIRWHEDENVNKVASIGFCALICQANIAAVEMPWILKAIELKFKPVFDHWKQQTQECEKYLFEVFEETMTGPFDFVFRESQMTDLTPLADNTDPRLQP